MSSTNLNWKEFIMVVDDDPSMCRFLETFLAERGQAAITIGSAEEAVSRYQRERPAAVILDVVMPGTMDGLDALEAFKRIDRNVPVIVVSGQGRTATVIQAMKLGAADFVSKPFDASDLEIPLARALRQHRLARDMSTLREQLPPQSRRTHALHVGQSKVMAQVRERLEHAAKSDVTVLIRGETGTGKELVARAVHDASARSDGPFVKVHCATLPTEVLESELFGFERGACVGAIQHKPGKFEFANQGTLFLDEIGGMSSSLQSKLEVALQARGFSRLGGAQHLTFDVRVIAATSHDLEQAVADGQFRGDLYSRLNVASITVPPLRDRRDDLPMLVEHLLRTYSVRYNRRCAGVSPEMMRLFMDYDWPGNVRELESFVNRLVVSGSESTIRSEMTQRMEMASHRLSAPQPAHLVPPATPLAQAASPSPTASAAAVEAGNYSLKDISRTAAREAERELILKMLQQTHWNRKETAEILGISYKALLYKIKENGLDKAV